MRRQDFRDRSADLYDLVEVLGARFRNARNVLDRKLRGPFDQLWTKAGNDRGEGNFIVLGGTVDRKMEIGGVRIDEQRRREDVCPTDDRISVVFTSPRGPAEY